MALERVAILLLACLFCSVEALSTKGDGFDGFGAPDPFNQNDDEQVDAGEPNAPEQENPSDDANMVSDDDSDDDESFMQVASKMALKKGDGFDGFGAPDPFNQNDDDQVDAGEPNAPDQENPNDDANMVSDDDADDDDSFMQVASAKAATKGDGFDGFGAPDPFNQNDDDQVDAGEPNAPDQENPNDDANMVSDDDADDDDSFVQLAAKKATKKGDGFDGFGAPDPFNQNDDDQVDAGEPNAPEQENPNDDANMVSDDDSDDDDSFAQLGSTKTNGNFLAKQM
jgi:hypothetical protein